MDNRRNNTLVSRAITALGTTCVILLFTSVSLACFMGFEGDEIQANSDGFATITAVVRWEHRKCVLDDDDINIDTEGLEIIDQSGWQQVKRGTFHNELQVKLIAKEGSVRIWRECSKKGISERRIKISR